MACRRRKSLPTRVRSNCTELNFAGWKSVRRERSVSSCPPRDSSVFPFHSSPCAICSFPVKRKLARGGLGTSRSLPAECRGVDAEAAKRPRWMNGRLQRPGRTLLSPPRTSTSRPTRMRVDFPGWKTLGTDPPPTGARPVSAVLSELDVLPSDCSGCRRRRTWSNVTLAEGRTRCALTMLRGRGEGANIWSTVKPRPELYRSGRQTAVCLRDAAGRYVNVGWGDWGTRRRLLLLLQAAIDGSSSKNSPFGRNRYTQRSPNTASANYRARRARGRCRREQQQQQFGLYTERHVGLSSGVRRMRRSSTLTRCELL